MDNVPTRGEFIRLTDQIKADQALRDAAPELLEACKKALTTLRMQSVVEREDGTGQVVTINYDVAMQIKSAIEKAETGKIIE